MTEQRKLPEDTEMIEVSVDLYNKLLEDSDTLERLKCAGVDNWAGYSDAFDDEED